MLRRQESAPSRSRLYDSDSDAESNAYEEYDEEIEEHEEERLLSEAYGEAQEGPSATKKANSMKLTDAEIASALNQEESKKKRIKRTPALDIPTLTGPKGLIKIRHEFRSYKYKPPKAISGKEYGQEAREREVAAAANYLSSIMRAYQDFATSLCPTDHYSNTFFKIQQLGSKKEVRDYLNSMRDDMAREYLESIYGREKTEKYMHELEHGLKVDRSQLEEEIHEQSSLAGAGTMRLAAIQAFKNGYDEEKDNTRAVVDLPENTEEDHTQLLPESLSNDASSNTIVASAVPPLKPSLQEESEDENEMDFENENIVIGQKTVENETDTKDDSHSLNSSVVNNDVHFKDKHDIYGHCSNNDEDEDEQEIDFSSDEKEDITKSIMYHPQEVNDVTEHKHMNEDEDLCQSTPLDLLGQTQDIILNDETSQTLATQDTLVMDASQMMSVTQDTVVATMSPTQDDGDIIDGSSHE